MDVANGLNGTAPYTLQQCNDCTSHYEDPATYPVIDAYGCPSTTVLHYWYDNAYPLCAGKPVEGLDGYLWFKKHEDAQGHISITVNKGLVTCKECKEYIHS